MTSQRLQRWLTIGAMMALPVMAHAQEATLSGTVSDTTGGALPGVTVRAVHEASGNSFEAVTDERGAYRLPVRVGRYSITAELAGFAPTTRTLALLVGQQAVVNLQMSVSGVRESVTVTGEAPLLDVTTSSLGGNIDPRQMQELPVNGRNWVDLVMLAPGARGNAMVADAPTALGTGRSRAGGDFELNIDGQQVTQLLSAAGLGQPRFSRDAIAEFELVSSRFNATQGRSNGVQVNAVTKSGTNTPSGSLAGYFRDDSFKAADHVARRVLPYQNQQLSGTFGGPIRKDKVHFFAHYEYEREPRTSLFTTPYPHFNVDRAVLLTEKKGGGRLDAQFSQRIRLAVRGTAWRQSDPGGGSGSSTISATSNRQRESNQLLATLTQVVSNRAVNEVRAGYALMYLNRRQLLQNPRGRFDGQNGPRVVLRGLNAGGQSEFPETNRQATYSFRDDFTYSFTRGGQHNVKLGAEYLRTEASDRRCLFCDGELDASGSGAPALTNDLMVRLFPDLLDASTWNLAPLSPLSIRWRQTFGAAFQAKIPRYTSGVWVQDDWTVSPRLTLNLGLRYDLEVNAFANSVELLPFLPRNRPNDINNLGPRVGFNLSLNDRTAIRGGYGVYFGTVITSYYTQHVGQTITFSTSNDGRPDFASNPYNGPEPTFEFVQARACTVALVSGCIRRDFPTGTAAIYPPNVKIPYSHQSSIGLQRQVGTTMAIEADYVYVGSRDNPRPVMMNLSFNPATGANYPFADISRRPYPEWGLVKMSFNGARSNQHSLQTAFTKRFSGGWQASGSYTLSVMRDAGPPARSGLEIVPFEVAPDLDLSRDYTLSAGDQRHRAVVNGIWRLWYGFQLSGLYFYGSGERFETRYGVDLRQIGTNATQAAESRLRPNGTIAPRNNLVGKPIHRVDLRVQRRIPLGGRAGIEGLLELFNAFNHANFGSYVTDEVSSRYGQPQQETNVSYAPRTLQLGFRFAF